MATLFDEDEDRPFALLGKSASPALLSAANPQDSVDAMLADPAFIERFAGFTNRRFNPEPGANVPEDASYTLSKYILENKKPWKDLFVGAYITTTRVKIA